MQLYLCSKYFIFVLISLFFVSFAHGVDEHFSTEGRVKELFTEFKSSVVRVKATRLKEVNGTSKRILKMGSGFFICNDGHVLTTGLLPKADRVWIEHNNEYFLTETLGSDSLCNISLLKTLKKPTEFNFVSFSGNDIAVQPGTFLLGLTYALEFNVSPSLGIIKSRESSFGRNLFPTKMLRTSLALGPGEVGAPVFDLNGKFVGITHAALPDLQSSFILPAKACSRIRDGLILSGSVDYGWFGITVTRKLNNQNGFNIEIKSPGINTKLKEGDVLVKIGNTSVFGTGDILDSTFYARPGTFVDFLVIRNEKELKIPIRVAPRSSKVQNVSLTDSTITKADNEVNFSPKQRSSSFKSEENKTNLRK